MRKKVCLPVLLMVVVGFLALPSLLPFPGSASAPQDPPPEVWSHGRPGDRLDDLHRSPGEAPRGSPTAGTELAIPAWSRMVFQSLRDGNWEIYQADASGSNQVRVTAHDDSDIYPALNRGCARIAFAADRTGTFEIYSVSLDGSGLARLTDNGSDDLKPCLVARRHAHRLCVQPRRSE